MPRRRRSIPLLALGLSILLSPVALAAKKQLGFEDLMRFRQIRQVQLSDEGDWVAYALVPDRGDGEAVARATQGRGEWRVERGSAPAMAADGAHSAFRIALPFVEAERAKREKADPAKPGCALIRHADGERWDFDEVQAYAFSGDGAWFGVHFEAVPDSSSAAEGETNDEQEKPEDPRGELLLRRLGDGGEFRFADVERFAFDETGRFLAVQSIRRDGGGVLRVLDLQGQEPVDALSVDADALRVPQWVWDTQLPRLSWIAAREQDDELRELELSFFDPATGATSLAHDGSLEGWVLSEHGSLQFSRDGARVFFGLKRPVAKSDAEEDTTEPDLFDLDEIRSDRSLTLWHWEDRRIQTEQEVRYEEEKKRSYRAVAHLASGEVVALCDEDLPELRVPENGRRALANSDLPYRREATWNAFWDDLYLVDLQSGERVRVVEHTPFGASLSPGGRYLAYFLDGDWHLYDAESGDRRNLTASLPVGFADEDDDYPAPDDGYGVADWLRDDSALLIHDKFDLWIFPTTGGEARRLTDGRDARLRHLWTDLDPEREGHEPGTPALLRIYDDRAKTDAFARLDLADGTLKLLRAPEKRLRLIGKAEHSDRLLYTEERYDEFPDLWSTDVDFRSPRRISEANPQLGDFDWGKAQLVAWDSFDGIPLQGVLITPPGYEKGKRYPVVVYFYRFFSQRLHEFNEPVINHRPSFPIYANQGYCVFLPDVRFEIGRPGLSAAKSVVPGVQKLIDLGIADPDAIGLHGHSWSGYTSAFIVTQTDIFAAVVSGAPVSNMTSAYSGIRWGSGIARQWQYEMSQSRIGGSLWEARDLYIENSPVFYADRIDTPMLIQHGDEDEAVPWWQSIELFLAMRRLGKECVFLQYRGEPHHLKQYSNKVDYSIKMLEFFGHYLKGEPAPEWMRDGLPYGED